MRRHYGRSAYEALLRWQDQTGKHISPAELSRWLRSSVLCRNSAPGSCGRRAKTLQLACETVVAVKCLDHAAARAKLCRSCQSGPARNEAPPHRLELEVTETAVAVRPALANEILTELRSLGIGIALDDFGTGFSSLRMVKELPLTRIKIDRSFVSGIDGTCKSTSVIRSVITLCEAYGLSTTAEGVEDR